ncbi:Phytochrome-like protein cph1 [Posidoniimonas polymericola]|uniref:histidine kinase n=1 Tax=Posidoniimonas polymericola TaxID=2528002 RepID=A0A5C5YH91_9BACT|nr:ATP-binding protein [Posidoniimonas polymericola]TWT74519.1 Phytochrome-like protein cph1 [Posidoniimonas polymericola]
MASASDGPPAKTAGIPSCCVDASAPGGGGSEASAAPFLGWVLDTSPYPPRWRCGRWTAGIGWLHIVSDTLIWAAYLAIPLTLGWFARTRPDLPFRRVYLLFGAFILLCGLSHLMEAVIFWWPAYGLAGCLKAATAFVSVTTVVALVRIAPLAMAYRSPDECETLIEQRTGELQLAQHEALQVIESSPTGIVMADESGVIIMVNGVTERIFGWKREDLVGRPIEVLLPVRYRAAHPAQRDNYFNDPSVRRMGAGRELFGLRANGEEFPVEIGLQPVQTRNGLRVVSAIVDTSERSAMARAIDAKSGELAEANAALLRSNQELETFAFVASHDLQEPLRKISSYCQLLKEEKGDQLDPEAVSYLDVSINGAERLRVLVKDLLSLSRIATQGEPLAPTDANACLNAALDNLALQIEESQARVECEGLPRVMADESQLTLLFQNLIGNALKYRSSEPPVINITAEGQGRECVVSIEDNGIGIPQEYAAKVFQIFQRLHSRDKYSGTGIGLALCRRVVERFGGSIWVDPAPGGGSVFRFQLITAEDQATINSGEQIYACGSAD